MSSNRQRPIAPISVGAVSGKDVLTVEQLKRIARHRYCANGQSLLEPYMQVFWQWLVQQIPLSWAPNALTLAGLIFNGFSSVILMLYSPNGLNECPKGSFLLCALGLFVYQSLDAIDGKQARRTFSSSPLGELFDHGCDAVSMVFATIATCLALRLGLWPLVMFYICFSGVFIFYCAHWQTYCSGCLQFGRFDVTETLFGAIAVHLVSGFYGASVWDIEIFSTGLPLRIIPVLITVPVAFVTIFGYIRVVFTGGIGKNGSTVAGTSVLSPGIPIVLLIVLALLTRSWSTISIYERHPVLFIVSFGFAASKLSIRLVISHMSRTPMCLLDASLIGPALLVANLYFSVVVDEYLMLWLCFVFSTFDLLRYTVALCQALCDYLNISCFRIPVAPNAAAAAATRPRQRSPLPSREHAFIATPAMFPTNGVKH